MTHRATRWVFVTMAKSRLSPCSRRRRPVSFLAVNLSVVVLYSECRLHTDVVFDAMFARSKYMLLATSERYRLQSDQFECIWLLLNELVKRLSGYFARANHSDFRVTFDGPIPLQEYFDIIDRHFEVQTISCLLHNIHIMRSCSAVNMRLPRCARTVACDRSPICSVSLHSVDVLMQCCCFLSMCSCSVAVFCRCAHAVSLE